MVKKLMKKFSKKIGMPPGALIHVGEKKLEKAVVTLIDYDLAHLERRELDKIEESFPFKERPTVTWLNIYGLHETEILEKLGKNFNIHPLVLEDILYTGQRPKVEVYNDYVFIVLKMIFYNKDKDEVEIEQLSLILGSKYVITFQEKVGDVFNPVRERLKNENGRLRRYGSDYLVYALMDVVIDNYFLVLEELGESIETLEEKVVEDPDRSTVEEIQWLKRELIFLRKSIWPLREVISSLTREEIPQISENTQPYLRDLYDHTIQIIDTIESFRDMVSGILDIYLSSISNKMNEVMKLLTIIATIFIPLTFIAGIYGMNFEFMPELHWRWAYPVVWVIMTAIFLGMLFYFRRKKWL